MSRVPDSSESERVESGDEKQPKKKKKKSKKKEAKKTAAAGKTPIVSRHVLGPYPQPLFVIFAQYGERRSTTRFRLLDAEGLGGGNHKIGLADLLDPNSTVYKLPAGDTCMFVMTEVSGGKFVLEFSQFPGHKPGDRGGAGKARGAELVLVDPPPPPPPPPPTDECTADCPPYFRSDCLPGETAVCSGGLLLCV